jgi:hypothetical protein
VWKLGVVVLGVLIAIGAYMGPEKTETPEAAARSHPAVVDGPGLGAGDEQGWCAVLAHLEGYTKTFPLRYGESGTIAPGADVLAGLDRSGVDGEVRETVCRETVQSYVDDHRRGVVIFD